MRASNHSLARTATALLVLTALAGVAPSTPTVDAYPWLGCVHHIANNGGGCGITAYEPAAIGLCPPGSAGVILYDGNGNPDAYCYAPSTSCPSGWTGVGVEENGAAYNQCATTLGPCNIDAATDSSLNVGDHAFCANAATCSTGSGPLHQGIIVWGSLDGVGFQSVCLSPAGIAETVLEIIDNLLPDCDPGWVGVGGVACVTTCSTGTGVVAEVAGTLTAGACASPCSTGYGVVVATPGGRPVGACALLCGTPGTPGWGVGVDFRGGTPSCDVEGPWIAVQPSNVCPPNGQDDVVLGNGPDEVFAVCL